MGYAVYWLSTQQRFGGYGVPCRCEHPDCNEKIDRGLAHVCGNEPEGYGRGCGLYFCGKHLFLTARRGQLCERCEKRRKPFEQKPDTREWMRHMMRDKSWKQWRDENPKLVAHIKEQLAAKAA